MTDLAALNALRLTNGKTELKSWKESKAKLADAIEKEQGLMAANGMNPKGNAAKKETAQKLLKLEAARTAGVNVAAIAKELGINAKVARAKLRKAKVDRTDAKAIRKALAKK